MARVQNLELITYTDNPAALFQLRKQFEDSGLREQERKITYALKRREAELSCNRCMRGLPTDCVSFVFNTVFFDWTCWYGMSPGRPLIFGCLLWPLCSLLYFGFIHTSGESGLYRIYGQSVSETRKPNTRGEEFTCEDRANAGVAAAFSLFVARMVPMRTEMFFSLIGAFSIGFRDINFGRWLRLLRDRSSTSRRWDGRGWWRDGDHDQRHLIALWVLFAPAARLIKSRSLANRYFEFRNASTSHRRTQETLPIVTMCVSNPDRSRENQGETQPKLIRAFGIMPDDLPKAHQVQVGDELPP